MKKKSRLVGIMQRGDVVAESISITRLTEVPFGHLAETVGK